MEIGATVEQEHKNHPKVLYHRVPGGWVVFSAGSAAYIPLNLDSVNDLRINVGQTPLTADEYATQNNAEHKAEVKEEKPKEPKPAPQMSPAAQQRAQRAAQNIMPNVMTPKPDTKPQNDGGPEPGR